MKLVRLTEEWQIGDAIGSGGFGRVYSAKSESHGQAAIKFVPKAGNAGRELLFVDLAGIKNVVPVIDSGETEDSWVLVMPRAEMSLQDLLATSPNGVTPDRAKVILTDICTALVDMDGKVVHRDIKPGNILLLNGKWCLADFGIARYAAIYAVNASAILLSGIAADRLIRGGRSVTRMRPAFPFTATLGSTASVGASALAPVHAFKARDKAAQPPACALWRSGSQIK